MKKRLTDVDVLALMEKGILAHGSLRKAAKAWGVVPSYVSSVRATGNPGVTIPKALGLRYEPGYYVRDV